MEFIIGIICVLSILAVFMLYQKNQTLSEKVLILQSSTDSLQALLNSTKGDLLNQLATKNEIIDQANKTFLAYKQTQDALLASMKENPFKAQQAVELLNQSADTIADAIIAYHTNLGQRPEQIQVLKYYYNGLKALFRNQDDMYQTYKAEVMRDVARNPGQFVSMLVQTCNQRNDYAMKLYQSLVGTYTKCRKVCSTASAVTSTTTIPTSTTTIPTSTTTPTSTTSTTTPTSTSSGQNCNDVCDEIIPLVPLAIPTGPLTPIDYAAVYGYGENIRGLPTYAFGFDPYKQADGMLMVAALVTFIDTFKKIMNRYCSMPINGNTVLSLVTSIMDDLYDQIKFMRKSMMLPMYNMISKMHITSS